MVEGPFGVRPLVYANYTASGRSLNDISYETGVFAWPTTRQPVFDGRLSDFLVEAETLLADPSKLPAATTNAPLSGKAEDLRWFSLPSDAKA